MEFYKYSDKANKYDNNDAEQCKVGKRFHNNHYIPSLINRAVCVCVCVCFPSHSSVHCPSAHDDSSPDQYWPNLTCRQYEEVNLLKKHLAATLIDKPHQFSLLPLFCNYSAACLIAAVELKTCASFAVRSSAALRNMNLIFTGSERALCVRACVWCRFMCRVCLREAEEKN